MAAVGESDKKTSKIMANDDVDTRPHCKYGNTCYRKNPDHFRQFQHPKRDRQTAANQNDEVSLTFHREIFNNNKEILYFLFLLLPAKYLNDFLFVFK